MTKEVQMTFRVEPELRASFTAAADYQHRPAAQVLREFMRAYVKLMQEKAAVKPVPDGTQIDAQRRKRQDAVNFARASVGLEGFRNSPEDEAIAKRFVDGEIDFSEFMRVPDESVQER
jgi:hypothetical protein